MRNNYYHNDRRDFEPPQQANVLRSQRHPRALFASFHVHGVMPVELERLLRAHVSFYKILFKFICIKFTSDINTIKVTAFLPFAGVIIIT